MLAGPVSTERRRVPFGRPLLTLLWTLLLLGAGLNGLLTWHQTRLSIGREVGLPGCSAEDADCNDVLMSPYGKLFGRPLSQWAVVYYFGAAGILLYATLRPGLWPVIAVPLWSTPALATAAWLCTVMHVLLHQYCVYCLAIHSINIVYFVVGFLLAQSFLLAEQKRRLELHQASLGRLLFVGAAALAVLMTAGQLVLLNLGAQPPGASVAPIASIADPLDSASFAAADVQSVKGNPNGKRKLVLFTCLSCTHCRDLSDQLNAVLKVYPADYRLEVRFAPLSPECNPAWPKETIVALAHQEACEIARISLALAAVDPMGFESFCDWIYDNQEVMTAKLASKEARLRIGSDRFDHSLSSSAVHRRLANDVETAGRFGIRAVPQLIVPGGKVDGASSAQELLKLFDDVYSSKD
jgi:uncharacterized membrane protein/protein-disulfide isomerase